MYSTSQREVSFPRDTSSMFTHELELSLHRFCFSFWNFNMYKLEINSKRGSCYKPWAEQLRRWLWLLDSHPFVPLQVPNEGCCVLAIWKGIEMGLAGVDGLVLRVGEEGLMDPPLLGWLALGETIETFSPQSVPIGVCLEMQKKKGMLKTIWMHDR